MDIWQPAISSEHSLRREPGNEVDKNAVAVVQETQSGNTTRASSQAEPLNTHPNEIAVSMEVVGHVLKLMAQWVKFLKRASNSGTVVITGKRTNRGAGYRLELPCEFKKCHMEKLQVLKKKELESVSFQKPFAYFSNYSNLFSYKTISNISSIPLH